MQKTLRKVNQDASRVISFSGQFLKHNFQPICEIQQTTLWLIYDQISIYKESIYYLLWNFEMRMIYFGQMFFLKIWPKACKNCPEVKRPELELFFEIHHKERPERIMPFDLLDHTGQNLGTDPKRNFLIFEQFFSVLYFVLQFEIYKSVSSTTLCNINFIHVRVDRRFNSSKDHHTTANAQHIFIINNVAPISMEWVHFWISGPH